MLWIEEWLNTMNCAFQLKKKKKHNIYDKSHRKAMTLICGFLQLMF